MLGALHRTTRLRPRSAAVLLCNPLGEEAARAHRLYRVLASQLERAGYTTLRFDYRGTGDSSGDDGAGNVEAWLADIERAAAELLRAAPADSRLVLVGLRLGATLAALATNRAGLRTRHLVLWDPVADGLGYLRELAAAHRTYLRAETAGRWRDTLPVDAEGVPAEALGTVLSPALASGLRAIRLVDELPRADHLTIIATRRESELEALQRALATRSATRWLEIMDAAAWNSDDALNAATVPMEVISAIVARIEEVSP